jgi:5,10-methenyltetrahydromethanopterin hydrogenase
MQKNERKAITIRAIVVNQSGIQPEIIDRLQDRVSSQSILTRHYLVPKSSFKDDVPQALEQL